MISDHKSFFLLGKHMAGHGRAFSLIFEHILRALTKLACDIWKDNHLLMDIFLLPKWKSFEYDPNIEDPQFCLRCFD